MKAYLLHLPLRSKRFLWIVLQGLAVLLLTACVSRVSLDEAFTADLNHMVIVDGTDLRIRCEGVGHGWYGDGGHFAIADLTVTLEGDRETFSIDEEARVGDYVIHLLGVDEMEDTCRLRVTARWEKHKGE